MTSEAWRERYQPTVEEPEDYDAWRMAIDNQRLLWMEAKQQDEPRRERQSMCNLDYLLGIMSVREYVYEPETVTV